MNPRPTQEQIGLFPAAPQAARSVEVDAPAAEAIQARDAALGGMLRRFFTGFGQALAAVGAALATWPDRRATYEKLRRLSDRELADIGLTRGDITRVFDPDFRLPAPANTNAAPSAPVQTGWRAA